MATNIPESTTQKEVKLGFPARMFQTTYSAGEIINPGIFDYIYGIIVNTEAEMTIKFPHLFGVSTFYLKAGFNPLPIVGSTLTYTSFQVNQQYSIVASIHPDSIIRDLYMQKSMVGPFLDARNNEFYADSGCMMMKPKDK